MIIAAFLSFDKTCIYIIIQIIFLHMNNARKLAEEQGWHITQEMPRPYLSSSLAKDQDIYCESCSLLLESNNAQVRVELLFSWNDLSVSRSTCKDVVPTEIGGTRGSRWHCSSEAVQELSDASSRDKIVHLLTRNVSN